MTDKELMDGFDVVAEHILSQPAKEPVFYFEYPERNELTAKTLEKWFNAMDSYKWQARRWEEQERGFTCCVDRAYQNWIRPECDRMYEFITTKQ